MKKIFILCLALVLALGSLGTAYALWYDELFIVGTVDTGTFDLQWTYCGCFDVESKDVGSISCQPGADPDTLIITVTNGYPCYEADCEVELTSFGTVPAHFESIEITPHDFTLASAYGANDGELYIVLVDGVGQLQLHQGDSTALSFRIHVEQCAAQGATYTFTVTLHFVQYNESSY
jgi:hypothetical protein